MDYFSALAVAVVKVLFLHQLLMPFVERDLRILRERHEVRELHFRGVRDVAAVWEGVHWADLVYIWFGSLHAFFGVLFARRLGKRSIVVAGGWDVGKSPDGMLYDWRKAWCPRYVVSHADLTLFVSKYNQHEALGKLNGQVTQWELLYHGFEGEHFRPLDKVAREPAVLTVGNISKQSVRRKGQDIFVRSAQYLPEIPFFVVGTWRDRTIDQLRKDAPSNVQFLGYVPDEELLRLYNRVPIYVQLSSHEAFGCSVAEAMLCECLPVVSREAALPEVVGDCGIYADRTPESLALAIREALQHPELGPTARQRILREFPFEARRDRLLELVLRVA